MKIIIVTLTALLVTCGIFSSCTNEPITDELEKFEIHKYAGYKIIAKSSDDWKDVDWYIIRNDSVAIKLRVPVWFGELYSVGDTIK